MRVVVDPDLCEGYGLCSQLVPELFLEGVDVPRQVRPGAIEAALRDKLQEAIEACPRNAISLVED